MKTLTTARRAVPASMVASALSHRWLLNVTVLTVTRAPNASTTWMTAGVGPVRMVEPALTIITRISVHVLKGIQVTCVPIVSVTG